MVAIRWMKVIAPHRERDQRTSSTLSQETAGTKIAALCQRHERAKIHISPPSLRALESLYTAPHEHFGIYEKSDS